MNDKHNAETGLEHNNKISRLDLNSIGTIAALVLSIVAISISVLEVTTMRTQQRAEVWPYLQITSSYSADKYRILLENKGVGPALVKSVKMYVDGQLATANNFDNIIVDLVGKENAFSYDVYEVFNPDQSVISSQEQIRLFSVPLVNRDKSAGRFLPGIKFAEQSKDRFNITVCYCSIHNDCWTTDVKTAGVSDSQSCQ